MQKLQVKKYLYYSISGHLQCSDPQFQVKKPMALINIGSFQKIPRYKKDSIELIPEIENT